MTGRNLGVLAAFVVAGALLVVFFRSGDSESSGSTTTTLPLSESGRDLVALLDRGRNVSFHAKYAVRSDQVARLGQTVTLELWRKPPSIRQDTTIDQDGKVTRAAAFFGKDVVACTQSDAAPWQCQKAPAGQQPGPDALLEQLTSQLGGVEVTESPATIAGQEARCFALTISGQTAKICARTDGVPALVQAGPSTLELTAIDGAVPAETFDPPAEVNEA